MGIGPMKFMTGRKNKFDLQMQGTCGPNKKFLDVTCCHPGSASDYTMWLDCGLRTRVEAPGFLKPGLQLYGDNAYINTYYMVTPFRQVSSGPKDAYNFYHSQLRITIEGAFGMLVHKWGCLRKPLQMNMEVAKESRFVLALCKLHNFCIDQREESMHLCIDDTIHISEEGGFALSSETQRVNELLDAGDPDKEDIQFWNALRNSQRKKDLPIYKMLKHVENNR